MDEMSTFTDCELRFTDCELKYIDKGYDLTQVAGLCAEEAKDCPFAEETVKSGQ